MNRFTEIRPQIADTGLEPCLLEILEEYYYTFAIADPKLAAQEYVRKWLELELENRHGDTIQAENANAV